MNLPIKKKAKIQTERLCLKPYSSEDAGRLAGFFEENTASRRVMEKAGMQVSELVEEEEYRGIIHKCYYCEINF